MNYVLLIGLEGAGSNTEKRISRQLSLAYQSTDTVWTACIDLQYTSTPTQGGKESESFTWHEVDPCSDNGSFISGEMERRTAGDLPAGWYCQVADEVHRAANSLPAANALLDVYLWPPEHPDASSSDYVQFLGALRRLKDWHNANVVIIEPCPTEQTEFLVKFLSAQVFLAADGMTSSVSAGLLWRGKLSVCDKLENKGVAIPGLQLSRLSENTADLQYPLPTAVPATRLSSQYDQVEAGACPLGRMLEVLDEVDLAMVPAFLKTDCVYKLWLYQKHPHSQALLSMVQENTQTGLLSRLAVYPRGHGATQCGETNLSTEAWRESILADIQHTHEPDEEYQANCEFLYFILTAPDKRFTAANFEVHAHLLHSPYAINGSLIHSLYEQSLFQTDSEDGVESIDLSGLPLLNCTSLREIHQDLLQLQTDFLKIWLEERKEQKMSLQVPVAQLVSYLKNIQRSYLQKLSSGFPKFSCTGAQPKLDVGQIQRCSELTDNSSSWSERLICQYRESQRRSFTRFMSTDSMSKSSPLQPPENSNTVDINDFLKFFQPDGSSVQWGQDDSSVIRRQCCRSASKLAAPDSQQSTHVSWPDSKDLPTHDVYYNTHKKCEKVNSRMNRLRDRSVKEETLSSFASQTVVFQRHCKKKNTVSPETFCPRRSPRKKAPRPVFDENTCRSFDRESVKRNKVSRLPDTKSGILKERCERESQRRFSTPESLPSRKRTADGTVKPKGTASVRRSDSGVGRNSSQADTDMDSSFSSQTGEGRKESRSERHKRKLQEIVDGVLLAKGVKREDAIFTACSTKLFKVTKLYVMDLPTSRNLKEEMKKIAEGQVKQVVDLESRRQGSSSQGRSKKPSL